MATLWSCCFLCASPLEGGTQGEEEEGGDHLSSSSFSRKKVLFSYLVNNNNGRVGSGALPPQLWRELVHFLSPPPPPPSGGGSGGASRKCSTVRFCKDCDTLGGSLLRLQEELEEVQNKIVNVVKTVRRTVITNSRLYGGNLAARQRYLNHEKGLLLLLEKGAELKFFELLNNFQSHVFKNDVSVGNLPLVLLQYCRNPVAKRIPPPPSPRGLIIPVTPAAPAPTPTTTTTEEVEVKVEVVSDDECSTSDPDANTSMLGVKREFEAGGNENESGASSSSSPSPPSAKHRRPAPTEPVGLIKEELPEERIIIIPTRQKEIKKVVKRRRVRKRKPGQKKQPKLPLLSCQQCPFTTVAVFKMSAHLLEVHETQEKDYACPDCGHQFSQKETYDFHTLRVCGYMRKCEICKLYIKKSPMKVHLLEEHQISKTYSCTTCGEFVSPSFTSLVFHQREHKGMRMQCVECPPSLSAKFYERKRELLEHLVEVHGQTHLRLTCDEPSCSKVFYDPYNLQCHKNSHGDTYRCRQCGRGFCDVTALNAHRRNAHRGGDKEEESSNRHGCSLCSESFPKPSSLQKHKVEVHHWPKIVCEQCRPTPKEFWSRQALLVHRRVMHGGQDGTTTPGVHVCDQCGKEMATKSSLVKHLKTMHTTEEKNLTCELCGFATKTLEGLKLHKRRHEPDIRPFKCPHCSKSFKGKSVLTAHVRIHTEEKPYACDHCGAKFNQRSAMTSHLKRHQDSSFRPRGPRGSKTPKTKTDSSSAAIIESTS